MKLLDEVRGLRETKLSKSGYKMELIHGKSRFSGNIRIIKDFGLELHCEDNIPSFIRVEILLRMQNEKEPIVCTGTVVLAEKMLNESKYHTIIVFDRLSAENKNKISKYFHRRS